MKMKKPIYELATSYANSDARLLTVIGRQFVLFRSIIVRFYKRHSRVSVRVGFLVFAVRGGDASPSGAGTSCGFVFLSAAGAGQQCSTQRHADRNTESRPR